MTDSAFIVTSVTTQDDTAIIGFADGHRAAFEGYSHGWGFQIEGLRRFVLYSSKDVVVQYDARLHRAGPQPDEHRFVRVAPSYTVERIVGYWEAARDYLQEEYIRRPARERREASIELWYPWMVVGQGWIDLDNIKEGRKPFPETVVT